MMDEETWFDADAAVEAGLADEIFEGDEQSAPDDGEFNLVRRFKSGRAKQRTAPKTKTKSPATPPTSSSASAGPSSTPAEPLRIIAYALHIQRC
jgi:hypothetical protein